MVIFIIIITIYYFSLLFIYFTISYTYNQLSNRNIFVHDYVYLYIILCGRCVILREYFSILHKNYDD